MCYFCQCVTNFIQNGLECQNGIFAFYFLHTVRNNNACKMTQIDFWGKFLHLQFSVKSTPKYSSLRGFLKLYDYSSISINQDKNLNGILISCANHISSNTWSLSYNLKCCQPIKLQDYHRSVLTPEMMDESFCFFTDK